MKLPNGDFAIVPLAKLTHYCLSPVHEEGVHKSRLFRAALGMTLENVDELRRQLLRAAATCEAIPTRKDQFGQRYAVEFDCVGPKGTKRVLSAWIIPVDELFPRLVIAYPV